MDIIKELDGKIDFVGQAYAEEFSRALLIAGSTLSFFAGYFAQSLRVTFGALFVFCVLAVVLVVPPWPMYRSHPVSWLPPVNTDDTVKKKKA
ncbi:microsomal signal peptidase 12kDa subunit [Schizophyllum fasciatum]